jgi:NAD(P)-dependent dehydrogenase (short-subunit alcohol dehydrogenase family)
MLEIDYNLCRLIRREPLGDIHSIDTQEFPMSNVAYLASPEAAFVTGADIVADSGFSA